MGLFHTKAQMKLNRKGKKRSKSNDFLHTAISLISDNIDTINSELAVQDSQSQESKTITLRLSKNYKIVLSFVNDSGKWILCQIESFKRRFRSWVTVMVFAIAIAISLVTGAKGANAAESQPLSPASSSSGVVTAYGTNNPPNRGGPKNSQGHFSGDGAAGSPNGNDGNGGSDNSESDLLSVPELTSNVDIDNAFEIAERRLAALKEKAQKRVEKKRLDEKQAKQKAREQKEEDYLNEKLPEEIERTSSRRENPLVLTPIKGYTTREVMTSGTHMRKKYYHIDDIIAAAGLPSDHLDQFETQAAKEWEMLRLFKAHCQSDTLLIREDGILNHQEKVLHIFDPKNKFYASFETWDEFDEAYYITCHQKKDENAKAFEKLMRNPDWNGNVGLSRAEHAREQARQKQVQEMKQSDTLFQDYYPSIAPSDKLGKKQIRTVPDIMSEYNKGEKLTPQQLDTLRRFSAINEGWQDFLNNHPNVDPGKDMSNLIDTIEPREVESLIKQINDIVGPTLGDVD